MRWTRGSSILKQEVEKGQGNVDPETAREEKQKNFRAVKVSTCAHVETDVAGRPDQQPLRRSQASTCSAKQGSRA